MADRHLQAKAGAGEAEPPPLTTEQFEGTPEFADFKQAMRGILAVPKSELDKRVKASKQASPRKDNPKAPGRKAKRRRKSRHD